MFALVFLILVSSAVAEDVCCFAKLPNGQEAPRCTEGIPRSLCEQAGGRVDETDPEDTTPCCCFAADAGIFDGCLPNVPQNICTGPSVGGKCQPAQKQKCCCLPPGVTDEAQCVRNIPVPLCDKTPDASCVADPTTPAPETPEEECICTFPNDQVITITGAGARGQCEKFEGTCEEPADEVCCCIPDGLRYPDGPNEGELVSPFDDEADVVDAGLCLVDTLKTDCVAKKRSGKCWEAPTDPPPPPPTCLCADPNIDQSAHNGDEIVLLDENGVPIEMLEHVCINKIGSHCQIVNVCCVYPSNVDADGNPNPCVEGIREDRCNAANGRASTPCDTEHNRLSVTGNVAASICQTCLDGECGDFTAGPDTQFNIVDTRFFDHSKGTCEEVEVEADGDIICGGGFNTACKSDTRFSRKITHYSTDNIVCPAKK